MMPNEAPHQAGFSYKGLIAVASVEAERNLSTRKTHTQCLCVCVCLRRVAQQLLVIFDMGERQKWIQTSHNTHNHTYKGVFFLGQLNMRYFLTSNKRGGHVTAFLALSALKRQESSLSCVTDA